MFGICLRILNFVFVSFQLKAHSCIPPALVPALSVTSMELKCELLLLLLGVVLASAKIDSTLRIDFPGPYCALRNTCCKSRVDGCSLPISSE